MKISNILALVVVSIFVVSCVNKPVNPKKEIEQIETDKLTLLKQQTEYNNSYVVNAKNQLLRFIGDKHFDNYIVQHGILKCQGNEKQSECVLNFYLTEYYKLKTDMQVKKAVADTQVELSKIENSEENITNYCRLSADFVNSLYTKSTPQSIAYYQQLFRLDSQALTSLTTKIEQDSYSRFLISENPTFAEEMKTEYLEKCLVEPKANIVNYSTIFR